MASKCTLKMSISNGLVPRVINAFTNLLQLTHVVNCTALTHVTCEIYRAKRNCL